MGTIYLQQLRDNIRSLRFQVSLAVLLGFFVLNGVIYTMKTERLATEDQKIEVDNARRYDETETVNSAAGNGYTVLNRPTGMEFMAEAGFNWFPETLWISPRSASNPSLDNVRTTNNWMRRFDVLDWTLIVRYVLTFLCIVLAYNAVSGEMESGTLRLVLANSIPRIHYLLAKFLAHLTTLSVAVTLGSLISLGMQTVAGQVELDGALWASYALLLLSATMLAALFLLLSMAVSTLSRNSASALVFLVTAWTVLVVIIPQASYLIATQTTEVVNGWDDMNQIRNDVWEQLQSEGSTPRDPALAAADGWVAEQRFIRRAREVDEEVGRIWLQMERQRIDQFRRAMAVNLLSPGYAFQYTVEALLGAGIQKVEHFRTTGLRYREHLRDFLRARDRDDPASPHLAFWPGLMSNEPLDAALIPRMEITAVPWETRMTNAMAPMMVLLLETALVFFLAMWAINRADLAARE